MTKSDIQQIYEEFHVPMHIRKHMAQVSKVAAQIANAYEKAGFTLDIDSIIKAALLHDALKVCTIKDFDPDNFPQEVTDEDKLKWTELREKYRGVSDAKVMCKLLTERGESKIAQIIKQHDFDCILEGFESLDAKIHYYADKRVKHDQIVSLKERLRDGRVRYPASQNDSKRITQIEDAVFELEKQLFKKINLEPQDIV